MMLYKDLNPFKIISWEGKILYVTNKDCSKWLEELGLGVEKKANPFLLNGYWYLLTKPIDEQAFEEVLAMKALAGEE